MIHRAKANVWLLEVESSTRPSLCFERNCDFARIAGLQSQTVGASGISWSSSDLTLGSRLLWSAENVSHSLENEEISSGLSGKEMGRILKGDANGELKIC